MRVVLCISNLCSEGKLLRRREVEKKIKRPKPKRTDLGLLKIVARQTAARADPRGDCALFVFGERAKRIMVGRNPEPGRSRPLAPRCLMRAGFGPVSSNRAQQQ